MPSELAEAKKIRLDENKSFNLQDLFKTIPQLKETIQTVVKKQLTAKDRDQLLTKSKESFGLVVDHPQFVANPLATIREHLTNVISQQEEKENAKAKKPKQTELKIPSQNQVKKPVNKGGVQKKRKMSRKRDFQKNK